jgi:hypothetical protein
MGGVCGLPGAGQELRALAVRMRRDALEHIAQVGPGIDPVRLARRDNAIEDGHATPPAIAPAEEPVLRPCDDPAQRAFGGVVVDGERAVVEFLLQDGGPL